jgi:heme/copper-type cytochrome/quinol oxidase subunit 2
MFSTVYLVGAALILVSYILMADAVSLDCKARNIKSRVAYSVLTFFFPVIVGIVYACTRKNAKKVNDEPVNNAKQLAKKSVITFIIAVIIFVGGMGAIGYSVANDTVDMLNDTSQASELYDMNGVKYDNLDDVLYYDAELNEYKYLFDEENYTEYFVNQSNGEKLEAENCYISEDGYLYYDENNEITANDDYVTSTDSKGNTYFYSTDVYWDSNGEMVDFLGNSLK